MAITSAQYTQDKNGNTTGIDTIFDGVERLNVPIEPANRHYAAILAWQASPEHYIVLDRTASNGANAGGKVLMENGDNILMDRIEPIEAD